MHIVPPLKGWAILISPIREMAAYASPREMAVPVSRRETTASASLREMTSRDSRREMVAYASRREMEAAASDSEGGGARLPEGETIIAQQFTAGLDSRLHTSRRDG